MPDELAVFKAFDAVVYAMHVQVFMGLPYVVSWPFLTCTWPSLLCDTLQLWTNVVRREATCL